MANAALVNIFLLAESFRRAFQAIVRRGRRVASSAHIKHDISIRPALAVALAAALAGCAGPGASGGPADLVLHGGKVWTGNPAQPTAEAIAIRGNRIVQVGDARSALALAGPGTRVVDLAGRLVAPGFNDAHTHFENAVEWYFQVRLIDVNDQATLLARLRDTAAHVPPGVWITGGDWADLASTTPGSKVVLLEPDLASVDAAAPNNPVLFRRADRSYFANSRAMALARIEEDTPDPRGGRYGRDPKTTRLNGMLYGVAGELVERLVTPASLEQKVMGARGVIANLNQFGITSIGDIAREPALSEKVVPPVFVERSFTDVRIFRTLRERGQLNVRVYAYLPLETWSGLAGLGITPNSGDALIRYGTLKAFGDAGVMLPPFARPLGLPGGWSYRFTSEAETAARIRDADKAGWDVGVHIIGDKAVDLLIDWYEQAAKANGPRDRRDRLIHAWYVSQPDIERAGRMHLVADVTPDHMLRSSDAIDRYFGPERAKNAFAWRSMIDHGVKLNLVSDLPGSFNKSYLANIDPLVNMYVAVARRDHEGKSAVFHADQALTVEEALRAYTVNPAWSAREDGIKGTLAPGMLADVIVLSKDILAGPPEALLHTRVDMTVMDGKPVYEAGTTAVRH